MWGEENSTVDSVLYNTYDTYFSEDEKQIFMKLIQNVTTNCD